MSIPKVIHYCWFGNNSTPKSAQKCIESWKKYCPGFEIICWNEDNFDFKKNQYAREAYEAGKWAFVSDYARLEIVYNHGGIYMDTDVELIKSIEPLTNYEGYMGFEKNGMVATGLGFGAEKGNEIVGKMLSDYDNITFLQPDGSYDLTPCPVRNSNSLKELGMNLEDKDQIFNGVRFLPDEYLSPMDYYTGKKNITEKTYSIHHYAASWTSSVSKRTTRIKRIIGVEMYEKLYGKFLHKFNFLEW
jgi:hypothetical protein